MVELMNPFAAGGALAGIGILWSKIKVILSKINSIFFVTVNINDYRVKMSFISYLCREFSCSKLSKKSIQGKLEYIRPLQKNRTVAYEIPPEEPTVWWKKGKPLLVKNSLDNHVVTFTYIRGLFNYKKLLEKALNSYNNFEEDASEDKDRFFIIKETGTLGQGSSQNQGAPSDSSEKTLEASSTISSKFDAIPIMWGRDELGVPNKKKAMDDLSLKQPILDVFEEAIRWKEAEKWFKDRNIPWKCGWLLTGDPGTGKTVFTRALAQELNVPVVVFELSTMTNSDFMRSWQRSMNKLPAIFLFEDIDNIFDGRKNICSTEMEKGVSFDAFLNTLDGIDNTDGIFVIISTNNEGTIDDALGNAYNGMSTRPGRIDRVLHFDELDEAGRRKISDRIFEGVDLDLWKHLLEEGVNDTGAQFQFRCSSLALKLWKDNKVD